MNVPFDVLRDGYYEVIAQIAQAPDYGDYVATLDGRPTNSTSLTWGPQNAMAPPVEIIHNYQPEIFVAPDHRLGWFKLSAGRHVLALTCVGKDKLSSGYNLGIDGVVLEEIAKGEELARANGVGLPRYETIEPGIPAHPPAAGVVYCGKSLSFYVSQLKQAPPELRAEALRSIGAFGEDAAPALSVLSAALGDPDPDVRSAAAGAIGQVGPKASAVAPGVANLLEDKNLPVRESAALALREMNKGAAGGIPDLCAALRDPAPTVRMTAASALGRIGEPTNSVCSTFSTCASGILRKRPSPGLRADLFPPGTDSNCVKRLD
jgi:hypothetical protein